MKFHRYHTFEELAKYKDDWNHLLSHCASHVPFLTFEYQQAWWQTRGGGEWPESSELVLLAAFQDEQLIGVAPLFSTKNIEGNLALMFVGAIEVSDYLDFIVQPSRLPQFLTGLIDFLLNDPDIPNWEVLDLYNILEDSLSVEVIQNLAGKNGWHYEQKALHPCPFIALPKDYATYLSNIDKKQRHEIRRKLRNAEQGLMESALYITQDAEKLDADVESFIAMMAQDPNKRAFLTDAMRQHLHNTARIAFEHGWLHLAFLTLNGNKAAANMSFNFNNRLWLYNSGWEWDYREYSPGWVLLAYLIEWAIDHHLEEFDFMRGSEGYKYKFGAVDRQIYRVIVTPK